MPTYRYRCPDGHGIDAYRPIASRHDPLACTECGADMEMVIIPPAVRVFRTYETPCFDEDGQRKMIGSRREHEDFLRRNGLEEAGDDPRFAPKSPEEIAEKRRREEAESKDTPMVSEEKLTQLKREGWLQEDITP